MQQIQKDAAAQILALQQRIEKLEEAHQQALQSEAILRTFWDSSTEAIVLADRELHFTMINDAALKLLAPASSLSEIVGKNILEIIPGIKESGRYAEYVRVIETGKPFKADDVIPHPQFGELNLSVRAFRVADGLGLIVSNFTPQRKSEKARRLSESRFRRLYESNMLAVAFWKNDGAFTDANAMFLELLGYSKEELCSKGVSDAKLTPDRYAEADEDAVLQIAAGGICAPYEKEYRCKDGSLMPVIIGGASLEPVEEGYVSYMIDVTDRKKASEMLLRTQKLESLSLLAGGIAHDFNNLLSGVYGYLDLALYCNPSEECEEYLSIAVSTIDRARGITQQLLTFAKGGAPNRKKRRLFPLLEETVRFSLSGSNVDCQFTVAKDLWLCNFDRTQLGQVFENLTINAQQAMPGGGTLNVVAKNALLPPAGYFKNPRQRWIRIQVIDSGIGIPQSLLTQIFDPFFTTKQKGSGLGLATCYSIIQRHGGTIDVKSDPGKGTAFSIYLPASEDDEDQAEKICPLNEQHVGNGPFLVMDDEDVVLDSISHMLRQFGYTVTKMVDGDAAVSAFVSSQAVQPFRAVILDLTVPGKKGGVETLAEIRERDAEVPIFVSSGYSNDPVMANPESFGFTDAIPKPYTSGELAAVLNRHLK